MQSSACSATHALGSRASAQAYSDAKGRCLAALLCRLVSRPRRASQPPLPERQWTLSWAILQSLATGPEARAVLLRCQLVPRAVPALKAALAAAAEAHVASAKRHCRPAARRARSQP